MTPAELHERFERVKARADERFAEELTVLRRVPIPRAPGNPFVKDSRWRGVKQMTPSKKRITGRRTLATVLDGHVPDRLAIGTVVLDTRKKRKR